MSTLISSISSLVSSKKESMVMEKMDLMSSLHGKVVGIKDGSVNAKVVAND